GLVDPGIIGEIFDSVVRDAHRALLLPEHGGADLLYRWICLEEMRFHQIERDARVYEIVNQQHPLAEAGRDHRQMRRDDNLALHRARVFDVGLGEDDRQSRVEDARHRVAYTQATTRDADNLVELPA